jgi:general secretion pathway protein A
MYERFFGFRERPFDLTPNPGFLVMTDSHREVLSTLEYAIASRKGVTLLLGEPGSGKTTLIRTVLQRQAGQTHFAQIQNPALGRDEFVMLLAAALGLSPDAGRSKAVLLLELEALLRARLQRDEVTTLVIDEAQSAPDDILEEIRLLANIETDDRKLLQVILAGQPELGRRLDEPDLRQLKQRIALRCALKPLSLRETAGYIAGRIAAAGGVGAHAFTREAVTLIHELSMGVPRTISVIADNALLGGFAAGHKPVPSDTVREVCRDFAIGARQDVPAPAVPDPRLLRPEQPAPVAAETAAAKGPTPRPAADVVDRQAGRAERRARSSGPTRLFGS